MKFLIEDNPFGNPEEALGDIELTTTGKHEKLYTEYSNEEDIIYESKELSIYKPTNYFALCKRVPLIKPHNYKQRFKGKYNNLINYFTKRLENGFIAYSTLLYLFKIKNKFYLITFNKYEDLIFLLGIFDLNNKDFPEISLEELNNIFVQNIPENIRKEALEKFIDHSDLEIFEEEDEDDIKHYILYNSHNLKDFDIEGYGFYNSFLGENYDYLEQNIPNDIVCGYDFNAHFKCSPEDLDEIAQELGLIEDFEEWAKENCDCEEEDYQNNCEDEYDEYKYSIIDSALTCEKAINHAGLFCEELRTLYFDALNEIQSDINDDLESYFISELQSYYPQIEVDIELYNDPVVQINENNDYPHSIKDIFDNITDLSFLKYSQKYQNIFKEVEKNLEQLFIKIDRYYDKLITEYS